ncbi:MAG: Uma2 family endonuclease [Roseiflexaceae bacterium]
MSAETQTIAAQEIVYPESDGKPMADNTKQFRWIVTIQGGLDALFKDDPNVFVAGDLLWYAVEGQPSIRLAPDVMVVFGRPKGDRGSYQQWREDGIAPQVVFEVLSPGNTLPEMLEKLRFYERYGCEEFYLYDPDRGALSGWIGGNGDLTTIETINDWLSPRLGVRFQLIDGELQLYYPDGRRFESYVELERSRSRAQQQADQERARAERLAAQLRALGIAPDEG